MYFLNYNSNELLREYKRWLNERGSKCVFLQSSSSSKRACPDTSSPPKLIPLLETPVPHKSSSSNPTHNNETPKSSLHPPKLRGLPSCKRTYVRKTPKNSCPNPSRRTVHSRHEGDEVIGALWEASHDTWSRVSLALTWPRYQHDKNTRRRARLLDCDARIATRCTAMMWCTRWDAGYHGALLHVGAPRDDSRWTEEL